MSQRVSIDLPENFGQLLAQLDVVEALSDVELTARAKTIAAELLTLGEVTLQFWARSRDEVPTTDKKEGFVILALHRQGAKGEPSFNACRETCREIVFQHNVILENSADKVALSALKLMVMVVRHLALFVSGKLEVSGLGEFCCASKSMRQKSDIAGAAEMSGTA